MRYVKFGLSIPSCTKTAKLTAELKWQTDSPSPNMVRLLNKAAAGPTRANFEGEMYGLQLIPIIIKADPRASYRQNKCFILWPALTSIFIFIKQLIRNLFLINF
jgi:hypothetical protein